MSLAESDDDEDDATKHPKVVTPSEQSLYARFITASTFAFVLTQHYHCRNQSISEQRFSLSQQEPDTNTTASGTTDNATTDSTDGADVTDDAAKKRAKLVYQKQSIDESTSPDRSSHDPSPDRQQASHDPSLDQQQASHNPSPDQQEASHDPSPDPQTSLGSQDQQTSREQLPSSQTQYQTSTEDTSTDHEKLHDLQPLDARSPSFMSLQNEGCTVQTTKQRKSAVLEQPAVEEIRIAEESNIKMKEDNAPSNHGNEETDAPSDALHEEVNIDDSKTQPGDVKVEDSSTQAKKGTDTAPGLLQVPSTSQQQRSMSVPSYPPQLKSILRRSNAPKSLSLDIHNIEDEDTSDKQLPLVHKMSVS